MLATKSRSHKSAAGSQHNYGTKIVGMHLDNDLIDVTGKSWIHTGQTRYAPGKFGNGFKINAYWAAEEEQMYASGFMANPYIYFYINSLWTMEFFHEAMPNTDDLPYTAAAAGGSTVLSFNTRLFPGGASVGFYHGYDPVIGGYSTPYVTAAHSGGNFISWVGTTKYPFNTRHHVSWGRSSTAYRLFIDGNLEYIVNTATSPFQYDPYIWGGFSCDYDTVTSVVDEFVIFTNPRIANFTPPTAPFIL